ncbi:aa3-type cytochrome c oxidase subunit IV [Phaeovulum sp.]|jgi:hypothetical protein|nr:aa3-type cytochrome c oxidase subunit IV [Phaeovulum sp.]MDP1668757.1 aa3-type cytochrome c oxidase subunit IV [Phaeovulum sp.]MDP2063118.1 aa3-type cytochrome c oxidase subunit IV [Phaeovulum sp.]MDP3860865.1 aa3-type cytochrome c oxidase subunit IV [Phaeovulum sp.]MDZ4120573.1 aa3-type cytochrome c oxidase subunit IV [Phaeovulum sp.]
MADHASGNMNIAAQQHTFASFVTFVKRASVAIAVILVFLAIVNG